VQRNLILRVVTGVVSIPVIFFLIHRGGWAYSTFVCAVVAVGAWEWWRLGRTQPGGAELVLLLAGALGALQGGSDPRPERITLFLALYLLLASLLSLRHTDGRAHQRLGHLLLGMLYVGLLPAFLIRIRALPAGRDALMLSYGAVFLCDTAAYAVGRALGRHALWPRISPRKTWEGAIGGLIGALLACVILKYTLAGALGLALALGVGAIAGTLGQAGDLVESLLKREAGIKDSSGLIPGHGGVLDRFDNLHFVAPVIYTYLALCI
jgi:phosphatidate cytidylyltransferase